jgi:hypothetical protein
MQTLLDTSCTYRDMRQLLEHILVLRLPDRQRDLLVVPRRGLWLLLGVLEQSYYLQWRCQHSLV